MCYSAFKQLHTHTAVCEQLDHGHFLRVEWSGFGSPPFRCQVTPFGKLFAHLSLSV